MLILEHNIILLLLVCQSQIVWNKKKKIEN